MLSRHGDRPALRHLSRRPRLPRCRLWTRRRCFARPASKSSSRADRSAAVSRRSTPGTAPRRAASARTFVRAFSRDAPIVAPSGSCATMASHFLPELVGCEPFDVWELSAFLDAPGIEPARRNEGRRVAYHDSCHMLRELRIADAPRRLLERSGAELVALPRPGSVLRLRRARSRCVSRRCRSRWPTTSWPARSRPVQRRSSRADPGCLMHLRGRATRVGRGCPRRPSGDGARAWNRRRRCRVSRRRCGGHAESRTNAGRGARQIVTDPRQIVTARAQTRARSSGIVEHEGGGWYPTLDVGGGARTWPDRLRLAGRHRR